MERDYFELGTIDQTRYDDEVWSSSEYRQHCSPHMEIIEDSDFDGEVAE